MILQYINFYNKIEECIYAIISDILISLYLCLHNFRSRREDKREKSRNNTVEISRIRDIPTSIKTQHII